MVTRLLVSVPLRGNMNRNLCDFHDIAAIAAFPSPYGEIWVSIVANESPAIEKCFRPLTGIYKVQP